MLKAVIEIDNYTAHPESPIDFIWKRLLVGAKLIEYNKKTKTATYTTPHAVVKLKNMRQV